MNSTSQVIFKIDKKLKARALDKAQREGIALSAMLKLATKAFVDGDLNIGLVKTEVLNAATRRELTRSLKDIKAGKNLSPAFKSAAEMIKYLEGR